MEATRFPLQWPYGWPRTERPVKSKFGVRGEGWSIADATVKLQEEVQRLNGQSTRDRTVDNFVLSTNVELNVHGNPMSVKRAMDDAGVAAYFKYQGKDMVIACDTFNRVGDNIYAIYKTIEAMRGIERWGCSELMQRAFTGFMALPERMAGPKWWEVLKCGEDADEVVIKYNYRGLSNKYHPDKPGGSAELMVQLNGAYAEAKKAKGFV